MHLRDTWIRLVAACLIGRLGQSVACTPDSGAPLQQKLDIGTAPDGLAARDGAPVTEGSAQLDGPQACTATAPRAVPV